MARFFQTLSLPQVKAFFLFPDGAAVESPLFVVASPTPISRGQKAVLIDSRTEVPREKFQEYLEEIAKIRREESP